MPEEKIELTSMEKFSIAQKDFEDRITTAVKWFEYRTGEKVALITFEDEPSFEQTKMGSILIGSKPVIRVDFK